MNAPVAPRKRRWIKNGKSMPKAIAIGKFKVKVRSKRRWSGLDAALRHPITLLLIGFLLTAVIGNRIQTKQHEIEESRAEISSASLAISHMREALAEYSLRARIHGEDLVHSEKNAEAMREVWIKADVAIQANTYPVLAAFPEYDGRINEHLRCLAATQNSYIGSSLRCGPAYSGENYQRRES
ncbi:hypothetical protein [Caballeronia concitans]|uniref:hypothetical protein n=1 Tax=Caballeronia concitans TaxID=1777133 RepID=UPI00118168D0|nr:hypothetical protein [Caballeronia concitans]